MLLAAAMLTMSFALNAQTERKLGFRAQVGANGSKKTQFADGDLLLGLRAGVALDIPIQDVLSFRPTLLFQTKGEAIPVTVGKVNVRPMYAELPLLLNLNMGGTENLNFYVNAGPYVAYAFAGKAKGRSGAVYFDGKKGNEVDLDLFEEMNGVDKDGEERSDLTPMNRLDAGINVNFGMDFAKHCFLEVGAEYGFLNTTNHVEIPYWAKHRPEYRASHNATVHFSVGVRF